MFNYNHFQTMAVNSIQFPVDFVKNNNINSPGYSKFYGHQERPEEEEEVRHRKGHPPGVPCRWRLPREPERLKAPSLPPPAPSLPPPEGGGDGTGETSNIKIVMSEGKVAWATAHTTFEKYSNHFRNAWSILSK
ncbi:MAG: hypothetical protein II886_12835 [Prevotella sp.]|nr:hypothetical protein [Prevotella sp.]